MLRAAANPHWEDVMSLSEQATEKEKIGWNRNLAIILVSLLHFIS